jgi:hypothetical protein
MARFIRAADTFGEVFPVYAAAMGGAYVLCFLADVLCQAWFA